MSTKENPAHEENAYFNVLLGIFAMGLVKSRGFTFDGKDPQIKHNFPPPIHISLSLPSPSSYDIIWIKAQKV